MANEITSQELKDFSPYELGVQENIDMQSVQECEQKTDPTDIFVEYRSKTISALGAKAIEARSTQITAS